MARSQRKAGGRGASKGRSPSKSTSRKKAPVAAEVEVVEEAKGLGIDDGIVLTTTVVLLGACLMVDYLASRYYDAGTFF